MSKTETTIDTVREAVASTVRDVIDNFKNSPNTSMGTLIERLDEECDALWGNLVHMGRIDQWGAGTLARHAGDCAAIIETAEADAWVEDDCGLWDGMTYGVLPSIAYFSLRNLLYEAMKNAGHDSNADLPFAVDE